STNDSPALLREGKPVTAIVLIPAANFCEPDAVVNTINSFGSITVAGSATDEVASASVQPLRSNGSLLRLKISMYSTSGSCTTGAGSDMISLKTTSPANGLPGTKYLKGNTVRLKRLSAVSLSESTMRRFSTQLIKLFKNTISTPCHIGVTDKGVSLDVPMR